jgi:broad specificity phosphatase PhoE
MAYSPASLLNPTQDFGGTPAIGAPLLYVVRHVQNDDDKNGRIRGLKDQPVNEAGEKQMDDLQDFFRDRPLLAVYTDDLSRTRSTALAIAQAANCGVETDLGLRSWDLGTLEGKSIEAHKIEIQDFKTHKEKVPTGGQSWAEFERTANQTLDRLLHTAMSSSAPIAIVTHGSFLQVFFERYGDFEIGIQYDHSPLDQAGVAALYLTREGPELKTLRGANSEALDA